MTLAAFMVAASACGEADARANDEPPSQAAAATVALPAPMDTLAADLDLGYTLGDPSAPIAVVEFSDFGCPYCARFARTTLPGIRQDYIDAGLVRWRYVPVVFGFPGGELMGTAAECAADQGGGALFWRVHDLLYERQTALRSPDARPRLVEWLGELGVDTARLEACMDAPGTRERLAEHNQVAQKWYVRGTPTFLVNGVPMSGAMPPEFFQRVFATVLDPSGL
ncbi:MAG: thioredoxin domain-containing protein [Gemmatimonadota bacterium]